jgi:hypothetical protein
MTHKELLEGGKSLLHANAVQDDRVENVFVEESKLVGLQDTDDVRYLPLLQNHIYSHGVYRTRTSLQQDVERLCDITLDVTDVHNLRWLTAATFDTESCLSRMQQMDENIVIGADGHELGEDEIQVELANEQQLKLSRHFHEYHLTSCMAVADNIERVKANGDVNVKSRAKFFLRDREGDSRVFLLDAIQYLLGLSKESEAHMIQKNSSLLARVDECIELAKLRDNKYQYNRAVQARQMLNRYFQQLPTIGYNRRVTFFLPTFPTFTIFHHFSAAATT